MNPILRLALVFTMARRLKNETNIFSNRAELDLSSPSLGQRGKFSERRVVVAVSAVRGRFVSSPNLFPFKHALGDPIRLCSWEQRWISQSFEASKESEPWG